MIAPTSRTSVDFAWSGNADAPIISHEDAREVATRIHALADAHRVRILSILATKDSIPMSTSELVGELGLSQSTVSHHLKLLVATGCLTVERRGTWSLYRAVPDALNELAALIAPRSN